MKTHCVLAVVAWFFSIPLIAQAQTSSDYFPLKGGNSWTYVEIIDPPSAEADTVWLGPYVASDPVVVNDLQYHVTHYPFSFADTLRVDSAGRIWARIEGADELLFDFTLSSGETYSVGEYEVTVQREEVVRVAAGHFLDPVTLVFDVLDAVDDERSYTFANGVGIISASQAGSVNELYSAQIDDRLFSATTNWLRYYPLNVGNEWHYRVISPFGTAGQIRQVVADTLLENDRRYKRIRVEVLRDSLRASTEGSHHERIDSSTGIVYVYRSGGDRPIHHLALPPDSTYHTTSPWSFSTDCDSVRADTIFGRVHLEKTCTQPETFAFDHYSYAQDIGVYSRKDDIPEYWPEYYSLVYAKIDGQEMGSPLPVAAENLPPYSPEFDVRLYPNPASDQFVITFTLPAHQEVGIALFDALGRRIGAERVAHYIKGSHSLTEGISHVARGLYFVRIQTNDRSVVEPLVIH